MKKEDYTISPQHQAQISFFDKLEKEVAVAEASKEGLSDLHEAFVNFCSNIGITNSFTGLHSPNSISFDEKLKRNLLMNIEMASNVAVAKNQGNNSTSISISNSNQQEQNVEVQLIYEALYKSLTGEQMDEIKELLKNKAEKKTIKDKLLSFGADVVSNVLATLISTGVPAMA